MFVQRSLGPSHHPSGGGSVGAHANLAQRPRSVLRPDTLAKCILRNPYMCNNMVQKFIHQVNTPIRVRIKS
jgi:hypothetical protein